MRSQCLFLLLFKRYRLLDRLLALLDCGIKQLLLDRIYRIIQIKATLFHPDYPANPVKNLFISLSISLILSY